MAPNPRLATLLLSLLAISAKVEGQKIWAGPRLSPDGISFTTRTYLASRASMDLNFSLGGIMALEGRCAVVSGGLSHQVCLPEKDWTLHFGAGFFAGVLQTGDRDQSNDALYNHAWRSTLGSYVSASIEFRPVESRLMFFADMRPAISFRPVLDFYPYNLLGTGVRYYFRKPSK